MKSIDLTQSDDVVSIPSSKRARPSDDSDVEVVEEASPSEGTAEKASEERQLGDDEDLVITGQKGQVQE